MRETNRPIIRYRAGSRKGARSGGAHGALNTGGVARRSGIGHAGCIFDAITPFTLRYLSANGDRMWHVKAILRLEDSGARKTTAREK
jgi:hypothetical protein